MFRKPDKPAAIPAWDPTKTAPATNVIVPGTIPAFSTPPPPAVTQAPASASSESRSDSVKPTDPFDVVLESVKDELKTGRRFGFSGVRLKTRPEGGFHRLARRSKMAQRPDAPRSWISSEGNTSSPCPGRPKEQRNMARATTAASMARYRVRAACQRR